MQKKVIQKRKIMIVIALVLFGLVFVAGAALAESLGAFLHYEDIAKEWKLGTINAIQSAYQEDEVLPHFVQFTDLEYGTNYYFYIYLDYYSGSQTACGFDKLYEYDYTNRNSPI